MRGPNFGAVPEQPTTDMPGRAVTVPLAFNGGFGFPNKNQGAIAGPTWVSPDGNPKQVRITTQGQTGGDSLIGIVPWQAGVSVWYKVRFWVKGARFESPFLVLNGGPLQAYPCVADRVEVFFYGVCTTNASPFNLPVVVNCGIGEAQTEPSLFSQFARFESGITGSNNQLLNSAINIFRLRVRCDVPGLPPGNSGQQPMVYSTQQGGAGVPNLVTLGGAAVQTIGGILVVIAATGVLGTGRYNWMVLPKDWGNSMTNMWPLAIEYGSLATSPVTAAGPITLGNTGLTLSFAAGTVSIGDQYYFPALRYWPMLFDATANPANGTTALSVGPALDYTNGYSADWVMDGNGAYCFQGAYVGLSLSPFNYQAPPTVMTTPGFVNWEYTGAAGG